MQEQHEVCVQYIETNVPLTELGPPEIIDIEPIQTCNLRCLQCHVSYEPLSHTRLNLAFLKNLTGIENRWALLGGKYEPFSHPEIGDIISGLSQLGTKLEATTNGTLFTPRLEAQIEDAKWANIIISFDGATKKTFEAIRRNADFDKTIESIINFKTAVQAYQGRDVTFSINYTILRSNIAEIPQAVGLWEGLGFDHISFIPMVTRNSNEILEAESPEPVMAQVHEQLDIAARNVIKSNSRIALKSAEFLNRWSKVKDDLPVNFMNDLVVSNRPETRTLFNPRPYFQNGAFPGMQVNCRSPFKYVRILYNGDVQLCFQFTIGSIYENNIQDIWYGKKAQEVRERVRKNPAVCYACDYYKFCIKADGANHSNQDKHHNESMVTQFSKPLYIQELGVFQIVGYLNSFYSFPKIMGHLDPGFFEQTDTDNKIFRADTTIDLKEKIRKFFEDNEPETLESITSPIFVQVYGKYNITAWWDGYIGIPKSYGALKIDKPEKLKIKGVFFNLSLKELKSEIEKFSATFELPDQTPESVEFKQHNISYWRGDYLGIPHALGAIDLESDHLDKLAGSLIDSSLDAVKEKISQKVLAEEKRQNAFKNLKIVAYRKHNTFHLFSEFFAVPQALGSVDLQSCELKQIKGILIANSQKELEKKIDEKIAKEEERQRIGHNLQIINYKEYNTFEFGSESFAVPQALGAFDPFSDTLKQLEGILTADSPNELKDKIDQKIIEKQEQQRSTHKLKIIAYKEHNTFQRDSRFFAVPQVLGAFDPLSNELENIPGVLVGESQDNLNAKIDQKIVAKEKLRHDPTSLKIISYKDYNTFQLGSEFLAVPQALGAFDPLSDELGNLPGVLTAESLAKLEKKINQKILANEEQKRSVRDLKIISYKKYNTFQLGAKFYAVPQALGAFDPLSDELGNLPGVLTANNQKEIENKIDQYFIAQAERQRAAKNLKIVAYKGLNIFQLGAKFYAVPQALGAFDPLSDELENLPGVLTADNQKEIENKIDHKIAKEEERQRAAENLQIVSYKQHNIFNLFSESYAVPQALGAFDPFSDDLKNLPGILTAGNQKKLKKLIDEKITKEEERQREAENFKIVPYKKYNTFQLSSRFYAVPQALGAFDPFSDELENIPGILMAENQKAIENQIDQKLIAEQQGASKNKSSLKDQQQTIPKDPNIIVYKGYNTIRQHSKFLAIPQALGAFDPQSDDLKNLPGVFSAIDQKILMNMIDQKILVEAERRRALENLKILSYKGYNVFHLVSESFAVPESHGDFDPLSEDLKKIPGILTAYDQKRLKSKIDQKLDSEKTD